MPSLEPHPKSLRFAVTLNLFLPGAGQLYLGQMVLGAVFAAIFIACFVTMLTLFLRAYTKYLQLSTNGNILEGDNLEQLAHAFPTALLIGVLVISLVIYVASMVGLGLSRKRHRFSDGGVPVNLPHK